VITTDTTRTTCTGLSSFVADAHSAHTAPVRPEQGTGLSFAGTSVLALPVQVAFGARVIDLPGLRPRGAPV
jgi:hypothetical protein